MPSHQLLVLIIAVSFQCLAQMENDVVKWILLLLFSIILAGCTGAAATPTPVAKPGAEGITVIDPPVPVRDFTLVNQANSEMHLADLQGKVTLLAFGYTHCPDICPVTLARFKQIKGALSEQNEAVRFVFTSVDGKRDTPERLTEYLGYFDPDFIGLTGDEASVRAFIEQYGGDFVINNAEGLRKNYSVDHTASTFLMDAEGRWIRTYEYNTDPYVIAEDILRIVGA